MNGYLRASQLIPGQKVDALHFAHPGNLKVLTNGANHDTDFARYESVVRFESERGHVLHWHYTTDDPEDDSPEWQLVQQPEATE